MRSFNYALLFVLIQRNAVTFFSYSIRNYNSMTLEIWTKDNPWRKISNVFLPHALLLTRRQFQRLKYSVCPSVYTDDLIFARKNRLIIATCCLYCRTTCLRRLVRPSINTAILEILKRVFCYCQDLKMS